MELLTGGTLQNLIEKRKAQKRNFSEDEIITLFSNILKAVSYMHVIHWDIKPENLLFEEEDNLNSIKLSDFGLSTQFSNEINYSFYSEKCGTMLYMAPE